MNRLIWAISAVLYIGLLGSASCNKQRCEAHPKPDCMCTMKYDPVCGCDGKTYGNACMAECAGVDVVSKGECGKQ